MRLRHLFRFITTLLILAQTGAAVYADHCPHAPLPRLRPGIMAVVSPSIDRLNLRALPAVGTGVVDTLRSGQIMTVISGPSCNSNYNWWRVELEDGDRGWVAEGTWDEFFIIPLADPLVLPDPFDWSCMRQSVCLTP